MSAVLGFLALLIFAWLIAGAVIGGPGEQEKASNQSPLAQGQDSKSASQEAIAPGVENRDSDPYSAFKSKDPFALPKGLDSKGSKNTNRSATGSQSSESKTGESKGVDSVTVSANRPSAIPPNDRPGGGQDGEDFTDQPSPSNTDSGGASQDGALSDTPGQGAPSGALGQGGNGGLFNSGGDLLVPRRERAFADSPGTTPFLAAIGEAWRGVLVCSIPNGFWWFN